MKRLIAYLLLPAAVAGLYAAGGEPAAYGDDQRASVLHEASSPPLPSGALVQLSPTLQPAMIGNFSFALGSGPNNAAITPNSAYMYVLANTYHINNGTLTSGSNKILTYRINSDGTLTVIGDPQEGQDTNGTSLYLTNQGQTLLTVDTDGSDPSATTAPFQVFMIHTDGSLSQVPNTIQLQSQTVAGPAALGPQAVDGSGQYFFAAAIDNNPNDAGYMDSTSGYIVKVAPNGTLVGGGGGLPGGFTLANGLGPVEPVPILNVMANGQLLYFLSDSDVYKMTIPVTGNPTPPTIIPYNDNNFFADAFFGMQISPSGHDFYAVDSPDGNIASLGICHYAISNDGTIQFSSKSCQTVFSNVPSGEGFGANGLYISPDNRFVYGLFQTTVGPTCSAAIYAYAVNSDGSLSPLEFSAASPANSLPIGNDFCSDAFIAGTADGSYVYAFGIEGQNNAIVPFRINRGLTSPAPALTVTRLVADVQGLGLPQGIERSLMSKLDIAQQDLEAGHLDAACGSLGAFVTAVNVQSGKRFGAVQAAQLIAEATAIGQSIGCRRGVP